VPQHHTPHTGTTTATHCAGAWGLAASSPVWLHAQVACAGPGGRRRCFTPRGVPMPCVGAVTSCNAGRALHMCGPTCFDPMAAALASLLCGRCRHPAAPPCVWCCSMYMPCRLGPWGFGGKALRCMFGVAGRAPGLLIALQWASSEQLLQPPVWGCLGWGLGGFGACHGLFAAPPPLGCAGGLCVAAHGCIRVLGVGRLVQQAMIARRQCATPATRCAVLCCAVRVVVSWVEGVARPSWSSMDALWSPSSGPLDQARPLVDLPGAAHRVQPLESLCASRRRSGACQEGT
jgi:hypothetical protein